jgi:hypothetical protein
MSVEAIAAVGASVVAFLAFCVSLSTARTAMRQKRIENFITIQGFLHREELSDARQAIREGLVIVSMKEPKVRQVCSSFDFAGVLVKKNALDKSLFLDYWGVALTLLDEKFSPMGDEETGAVKVKDYYRNFYWLMKEAKEWPH